MVIRQLVLVLSENWEAYHAKVFCYEKEGGYWKVAKGPFQALIGRQGMAWGRGVHPAPLFPGPLKREGDGKTPAGIFTLGEIFGYGGDYPPKELKMPFLSYDPYRVSVDDMDSMHYNRFALSPGNWKSAERMDHPLYSLGMVVHHNFPSIEPGAGSCIFFHETPSRDSLGTAGCTALSKEDLLTLFLWLDQEKSPHLIQLPTFF